MLSQQGARWDSLRQQTGAEELEPSPGTPSPVSPTLFLLSDRPNFEKELQQRESRRMRAPESAALVVELTV